MLMVMPSQVVEWIAARFDFTEGEWEGTPSGRTVSYHQKFDVTSLVELVDSIPRHLFVLDSDQSGKLVSAMGILRSAVRTWENIPQASGSAIEGMAQFSGLHPITVIRQALSHCPDEAPSPDTTGLEFIEDPGLRESIRLDISTANIDLANGESKAATVMAGAAIEALLLWVLQEHTEQAQRAQATAEIDIRPPSDLERWDLWQMIAIVGHLDILRPDTLTQAKLAQNFRNLIHPGRSTRLGQTCDRGTALSAVAAIEHVSRDLAQRYTK